MCGRFTTTVTDPELLQGAFDLSEAPEGLTPRYNVAPTQPVAVVLKRDGGHQLDMMRWGLIPSWSKDPKIGSRLINARGETVHEKPSFRAAFKKRRCLIVADGFYEWRKTSDGKIPTYIRVEEGQPFGMAGLWERWTHPDSGEILTTCTIITTRPNSLMETIHNRMPVILPRQDYAEWLDVEHSETAALKRLLVPYPAEAMSAYPVSKRVNSPRNDSPDLIERYPEN